MAQQLKLVETSVWQRIREPASNFANTYLRTFGLNADWRTAPFDVLYEQARLLEKLNAEGFVTVSTGMFGGLRLRYARTSADHELLQKCLGIFEVPLHRHLGSYANNAYHGVLNIGSVDGYYAMGLAKIGKPEVVHVIEPSLEKRTRLMANLTVNNISCDIEVDASINSDEVGQIARIYERLFVFIDDPEGVSVAINQDTIQFLGQSDIIIETTNWERSKESHALLSLLHPSHSISLISENFIDLSGINREEILRNGDYRCIMWNGKKYPKTWLCAQPRTPSP
jgi:hypothetical protein